MNYFQYGTGILLALTVILIPLSTEAVGILEPRSEDDRDEEVEEERERDDTDYDIREMVEDEFGEDHPMVEVARCESSFRQFDSDGDVLENPESSAIGVFQILENLHEEPAEDLGLDIFTPEGNIEYARELYDSLGLQPWSPSSLCWDDGNLDATTPDTQESESTRIPVRVREDGELVRDTRTSTDNDQTVEDPVITKKLVGGVRDPEVVELQRLLNDLGYSLSNNGPGSSGNETNFFGAKTRQALQDFQCDKNIVCEGRAYSTGYGLVNEETRQELNQAAEDIGYRQGVDRVGDVLVRTGESNNTEEGDESTQEEVESDEDSSNSEEDLSDLASQIAEAAALISDLQSKLR